MKTITKKQYSEIHKDYKGVYSSDDIHGTNQNGKKTFMHWEEGKGTCLLIEGSGFEIVATDAENVNPVFLPKVDPSNYETFRTVNFADVEFKNETLKETVFLMLNKGFQIVIPEKTRKVSYCRYQQGENIAYLQAADYFEGVTISTIHNSANGSGFGTGYGITENAILNPTIEDLQSAFILFPYWEKKPDSSKVKKYKGFKDYFSKGTNRIVKQVQIVL